MRRMPRDTSTPMIIGSLALKMCWGMILHTTGKTAVAMAFWVGGWVSGCVGGWVEENEAVGMSY